MGKRGTLRVVRATVVAMFFAELPASAQIRPPPQLLQKTIVAREVDAWFYADGQMKHTAASFDLTYEVTDSSVVRRTVTNRKTGDVLTDDTEYRFLDQQLSADRAALVFKVLSKQERASSPVIRSLGAPGLDAVEVLIIGPDWMQSVKTVADYMVISRYKRSQ